MSQQIIAIERDAACSACNEFPPHLAAEYREKLAGPARTFRHLQEDGRRWIFPEGLHFGLFKIGPDSAPTPTVWTLSRIISDPSFVEL